MTAKVVSALECARHGRQEPHELEQRQGRKPIAVALLDQLVERLPVQPFEHDVRHETAVERREGIDMDTLRSDILDVVGDTLRPAHAGVWLRPKVQG